MLAAVIVVAALVSRELQQRERAEGLLNQVMAVEFADLPSAIAGLEPYRDRLRSRLGAVPMVTARHPDADAHLRATLANRAGSS